MYEYRVQKVERVVDGDTFYFLIDLGFFASLRVKIRLQDIDTPESYRPRCKAELEHARKAKDFVEETFNSADAIIIATEKDPTQSFGRWIADITIRVNGDTYDLADALRKNGFEKRSDYTSN